MDGNIIPKTSDTVWAWIKLRLALQNLTFSKLSQIYGVSRVNFSDVRKRHSPKYELIIANHIGIEPWNIWPERYDAEHKPIHKSLRKHKKTKPSMDKYQKYEEK